MRPTRIYIRSVLPLIRADMIKGCAHITGGGLIENPPRAIAKHLTPRFDWRAWMLPPVFDWLQREGGVSGWLNCAAPSTAAWAWCWWSSLTLTPAVMAALLNAGEDRRSSSVNSSSLDPPR